ncbi:MAG: hypothetical protein AAF513_10905 [Pseudomonadota bacterium]
MRPQAELARPVRWACLLLTCVCLAGCASVYSSQGLSGTWALQVERERVEFAINPDGYGWRRVWRDDKVIEHVEFRWSRDWVGFVFEERSRRGREAGAPRLKVANDQAFPYRYAVHGVVRDGRLSLRVLPLRAHLFTRHSSAWIFSQRATHSE